MVVHEDISMQPTRGDGQSFAKQGEVVKAVLFVEKARQAVVAALYDVLWDAG